MVKCKIMKEIEISQIDTRFEEFRLKDKNQEKALLSSILEQGIREPLRCVVKPEDQVILLDGFKRLRCSKKLGIKMAPIVSLGTDEATGILQLIRLSNMRSMNILEQAALVDELKETYGLSAMDIARHLERSPAWVRVRLGIIDRMSPVVKEAVFSGRFPVRSYMYTLRKVTRVTRKSDVDAFVNAVSGKGLSTRAIETLAHGFFNGGPHLKDQILQGNLDWTLKHLRPDPASDTNSCNEQESRALKDLEIMQRCIGRVPYEIRDSRLKSSSFFKTAYLLSGNILDKIDFFVKVLIEFYDKRRQKKSS